MKKLLNSLVIITLCIISISTNAQDLITKKDGTDISAKVLEVTITEIKYKKFENLSGPIFTMLKSDVLMIRYENGTKDIFNEPISVSSNTKNEGTTYFNEKPNLNSGFHEMIVGEKVDIYKKNKNLIFFIQDDNKLKYPKMVKKLAGIEVCSDNMRIAYKYRKRRIIYTCAGILLIPMTIAAKKQRKYVILAIEDYNKSLK